MKTYPLAKQGVFWTVQGEGALLGEPMVFVRLAGCSIGCDFCDTDYRLFERATADEIAQRVCAAMPTTTRWVWVTGGEPTDHDLAPLQKALRRIPGVRLALATAGHKLVSRTSAAERWDWLSVSPHDPAAWVQFVGSELKLVPTLALRRLADFAPLVESTELQFRHRWVCPCADDPKTVAECVEWLKTHEGWRLNVQAHKEWNLP